MVSQGKKKKRTLIDSFKNAFEGLFYALRNVKNMKIHLIFTFLVIIGGIFFKISFAEWLVVSIFITLVISLEMINTAIELSVDLAMPNIHPIAKIAKDTAAGAVLVSALVAFVVGFVIFLPKIIEMIGVI